MATKKKTEKRGRPKTGKEARITTSVRVEPRKKKALETRYNSVQKFFDLKIKEEFGHVYEAILIPKKSREVISPDDF